MRSQITSYFHVFVLAICFSVLITRVSSIYCVQCSSTRDPFCHLGIHEVRQCAPSQDTCVTTVTVQKIGRAGLVTRGCTTSANSGCRMKNGAFVCRILCHRDGCNTFHFLNSGLRHVRPYGTDLY